MFTLDSSILEYGRVYYYYIVLKKEIFDTKSQME